MMMTPFEALTGTTLNASLCRWYGDRVGSLDVGKQADFLLLDGDTPAIIAYHPELIRWIVFTNGENW
jgi:imidazolonepropionase